MQLAVQEIGASDVEAVELLLGQATSILVERHGTGEEIIAEREDLGHRTTL